MLCVSEKLAVEIYLQIKSTLHVKCKAPHFGHTCDKEISGMAPVIFLIHCIPFEEIKHLDQDTNNFINKLKEEYKARA